MPMILITGQKAIMSSQQARFQIVDMVATMKPLTKLSRQIVSTASIPTLVRDAFRVAAEERPGPVHLELPEDVAGEEAAEVPLVPPHPVELPVAHTGRAGPGGRDDPCRRERPLVMLGAAASRPRLGAALPDFLRRTRIPFFSTQMGKGGGRAARQTDRPVDGHRGAVRSGTMCTRRSTRPTSSSPIGHDTVEKPPFIMGPGGPTVIHVGYTPANVEEVYFPHAEVVGDVGPSLALLADRLEGKLPNASALLPLREGILRRIMAGAAEDRFPLTPQRIVADVREVMPDDGIVALDNGMYKIWFARNYRARVSNTLLLDNALATMGAGLPSAMMAAMLYPDRRVLAVCGDGGFMMNSQEIETAVRLKLNLVVLILQDDAYGMIRWKQAVDDFADFGLTFGNPDFVKYAEAYGAKGSACRGDSGPGPHAGGGLRGGRRAPRHGPGGLLGEHPGPGRRAAQPRARARRRRRTPCEIRAAVLGAMGAPSPYATRSRSRSRSSSSIRPGPGEVLVRIKAAGLCHSDLSVINGDRPRPMPMALGHEAAGIVEEVGPVVGEAESDLAPGDHVVFVFVPSCGHCEPCAEGRPALCEPGAAANGAGTLLSGARRLHRSDGTAVHHHLGVSAFAEYATVSRRSLVKIDPELPLEEAALFGCAVLTGVGAVVNTARVPAGSLGGGDRARRRRPVLAARCRRRRGARDRRDRPLRRQARLRPRARRHRDLQRRATRTAPSRSGPPPRRSRVSPSSSPARSGRSSSPTGSRAAAARR